MKSLKKIGFGGGCHWCTEAIFQHVPGVQHVDQGWVSSNPPSDEFSEAVIVQFDDSTSVEKLTEIHLATHSSRSQHPLRRKYRSAIYYFDEEVRTKAESYLLSLGSPVITKLIPMLSFKRNQERYIDYYKKNPEAEFCQRYIEPKLKQVRKLSSG